MNDVVPAITIQGLALAFLPVALVLGIIKMSASGEMIATFDTTTPVADRVLETYAPAGQLVVADEKLDEIRDSVGEKAVAVSTDAFDHWPFNRERSAVIESMLRERMESMPPDQFQDLLPGA